MDADPLMTSSNTNVSFSGCGFLCIYHVGVAACLQRHAPHLLRGKIGGSSAGALAALAIICDIPMVEVARSVAELCLAANQHMLKALSPGFSLHQRLRGVCEALLPEDVAARAQGRLAVSVTRLATRANILVTEWSSREEVIQAVLASAFVPCMSGWSPPRFRGELCVDGCYSDNLPSLGPHTLTVSPFSGDADICPQVEDKDYKKSMSQGSGGSIHLSRENLTRLTWTVVPPCPRRLQGVCAQGWRDALAHLLATHQLRCGQCGGEGEGCELCREARHQLLPAQILAVFDEVAAQEQKQEQGRGATRSSVLSSLRAMVEAVLSLLLAARLAAKCPLKMLVASAKSLLSSVYCPTCLKIRPVPCAL